MNWILFGCLWAIFVGSYLIVCLLKDEWDEVHHNVRR